MTLTFDRLPVADAIITGYFEQDYGGYRHRGVDFGGADIRGKPIVCGAAGVTIPFTNSWTTYKGKRVKSFGEAVCIDHGENAGPFRYSLYAHMSKVAVEEGTAVLPGDILGYVGDTGVADGAHLHWQLCTSSYFPIDITQSDNPLDYMEADLTEDQVRGIIKEMRDNGDLASTTDVLACIAQIVGVDESTYSDEEKVAQVRAKIQEIATPPAPPAPPTPAAAPNTTSAEKTQKGKSE